MAIITTEGGRDSDSYVTLEDMGTYLNAMYPEDVVDDWGELDTIKQEYRVKIAVLFIDELPFRGALACRDQKLQFPRWWSTDLNYPAYEDQYIDMSDIPNYATPTAPDREARYGDPPSIPSEVKNAQMEFALRVVHKHLLSSDADLMEYPEHEVRSFTLGGGMTIDFFSRMSRDNAAWDKAQFTSTSIAASYLSRWIQHIQGGVV